MVVYIKLTALGRFYIHLHVARAEIMLYNLFSFLRNDHQRNAQVSADGKYIIRVATIISTRLPREHGPSLLFPQCGPRLSRLCNFLNCRSAVSVDETKLKVK